MICCGNVNISNILSISYVVIFLIVSIQKHFESSDEENAPVTLSGPWDPKTCARRTLRQCATGVRAAGERVACLGNHQSRPADEVNKPLHDAAGTGRPVGRLASGCQASQRHGNSRQKYTGAAPGVQP